MTILVLNFVYLRHLIMYLNSNRLMITVSLMSSRGIRRWKHWLLLAAGSLVAKWQWLLESEVYDFCKVIVGIAWFCPMMALDQTVKYILKMFPQGKRLVWRSYKYSLKKVWLYVIRITTTCDYNTDRVNRMWGYNYLLLAFLSLPIHRQYGRRLPQALKRMDGGTS